MYGVEVSKFADAGYDSSNFFLLLGPLLIGILLYIVFIILKSLARLLTMPCKENFLTKRLRKPVPYLLIVVRFLLEGCVEIGMSAMICIVMINGDNFDHIWEAISTVSAFVALILLLMAPCVLTCIMTKYLREVKESKDRSTSKYNDLFSSFCLNAQSIAYLSVFFLRRYIVLVILTLMPKASFW